MLHSTFEAIKAIVEFTSSAISGTFELLDRFSISSKTAKHPPKAAPASPKAAPAPYKAAPVPPKAAAPPQGKSDAPRGFRSELMNKIKKNPWKTLGTALLATAFPVGTVIAGVIATRVVAKSAIDSNFNKNNNLAAATTKSTPTPPQRRSSRPYSQKIKPPSTPTVGKAGKGQTR